MQKFGVSRTGSLHYSVTKPSHQEVVLLLLLFAAFLIVNLLTSTRFPIPWYDEVQFVDPAANLYFNNSFTTTAYGWERASDFHAHHPLYSLLLAHWFNITGFGLVQARALNYVLVILTAVTLWLSVARSGLIPSTTYRLWLVLLLLFGYSVSFPYRTGRIEPLLMFLSALLFFIFTVGNRRWRIVLLACTSLLFAPAALHLVVFAVILTLVAVLYLWRSILPEITVIWISLLISVIGLFSFYAMNGVWENALAAIKPHTASGGLGTLFSGETLNHHNRIPKDPSLAILLGVLGFVVAIQIRQRRFQCRSVLSFGLVASSIIPVALLMIAKFPTYYSWMVFVPLAVCLCSTVAGIQDRAVANLVIRAGLVMACVAGLPTQLVAATYDWQDRDYAAVREIVATNVGKDDWVLCDYPAYFAVKPTVEQVFLPDYVKLLTEEEKRKVTLLIGSDDMVIKWRSELGGEWTVASPTVLPKQITIIQRLTGKNVDVGLIGKKYRLAVYKRRA
jgi:hypothetical protein